MEPKGSYKTNGGKWFIACWECKTGINGKQTCTKGLKVKDYKHGCFLGQLLDKLKQENEQ